MTVRVLLVSQVPDQLTQTLSACAAVDLAAVAASPDAAAREAARCLPDVVLVDLGLPAGGAVAATDAILAAQPHCAVCLVAADEQAVPRDSDALIAALQAGARGYVLATAEPDDLATSLCSLARGGVVITPEFARDLVTAFDWSWADALVAGRPGAGSPLGRLEPEERRALLLIGTGLSHAEIAGRLASSERGVRLTLRRVLERLRPDPGAPPDGAGSCVPRHSPPGGLAASAAASAEDEPEGPALLHPDPDPDPFRR